MLRKLMKHELLATGRIMLPMFALVLLAGVGGNLSTYQLLETGNSFFNTVGVLLLMVFIVAIFATIILSYVLMIHRFHKNLLRDEGYLMMTLPVTVHEHIAAKLIVSVIWFTLTLLTVILSIFVLLFQAEPAMQFVLEVGEVFGAVIKYQYGWHALLIGLELLVLFAASLAGSCLMVYAAIAIGHSFSEHKTLLSFAAYFLMQGALQALGLLGGNALSQSYMRGAIDFFETSMTQTTLADGTLLITPALAATHLLLLFAVAASALFGAVFYAIAVHFMTKKLNLN